MIVRGCTTGLRKSNTASLLHPFYITPTLPSHSVTPIFWGILNTFIKFIFLFVHLFVLFLLSVILSWVASTSKSKYLISSSSYFPYCSKSLELSPISILKIDDDKTQLARDNIRLITYKYPANIESITILQ